MLANINFSTTNVSNLSTQAARSSVSNLPTSTNSPGMTQHHEQAVNQQAELHIPIVARGQRGEFVTPHDAVSKFIV